DGEGGRLGRSDGQPVGGGGEDQGTDRRGRLGRGAGEGVRPGAGEAAAGERALGRVVQAHGHGHGLGRVVGGADGHAGERLGRLLVGEHLAGQRAGDRRRVVDVTQAQHEGGRGGGAGGVAGRHRDLQRRGVGGAGVATEGAGGGGERQPGRGRAAHDRGGV